VRVIAHATLGTEEDLANATLVVYNPNYPESKSLAEYYAARRGVLEDRLTACLAPRAKKSTVVSAVAKLPTYCTFVSDIISNAACSCVALGQRQYRDSSTYRLLLDCLR